MNDERANPPAAGVPSAESTNPPRTGASTGVAPIGLVFDFIDEAIEESMITSDPPAFTPATGIGAPRHDGRAGQGGASRD